MSQLYVGNIDSKTTIQDLVCEFEPYGEIRSVKIPETWCSRGYAFLEFKNRHDAQIAIQSWNAKFNWRVHFSHHSQRLHATTSANILVSDGVDNMFVESPNSKYGSVNKLFDEIPKSEVDIAKTRSANKGMKLEFVGPIDDGIMLEQAGSPPLHENWKHCLVGCFTGRFPGIKAVNYIIHGWGVKCKTMPYAKSWTIFKFECEEDRLGVLSSGPYVVYGKTLILKRLSENFKFDSEEFLIVPLWVKFYGMPVNYWTKTGLSKVASKLGKPMYTDRVTKERTRISYARILVEVDLRKEPIMEFPVRLPSGRYTQRVEYENFPNYCYHCLSFGHSFVHCKEFEEATQNMQAEADIDVADDTLDVGGTAGESDTIIVQKSVLSASSEEDVGESDTYSSDDEDEDPNVALVSDLTVEYVAAVRERAGLPPLTKEKFEFNLAHAKKNGAVYVKIC